MKMEFMFPCLLGRLARSLVTAGISVGGICMLLLLSICIYARYFRKKNGEESNFPPNDSMAPSTKDVDKDIHGDTGSKFILLDKSPEFSYEELANATDNFSLANKIGQGGFGQGGIIALLVLLCIDHLKQKLHMVSAQC
ncbi:unnamed protein product [Trifolium pratense]|uniref:Uncharacterized protein n=1 Tax=Trifolium pratense TaxID=57577 RepID=A0ACB0K9Y5_TRIPR|nr:unnamed protein product [Trifolium pratense]